MAQSPFPSRIEQSLSLGNLYEREIAPVFFADLGWSHESASSRQNWNEKFDYIARKKDKSLRVEVKAPKKCKADGSAHMILLEHTGITGMPGWLRGNADVILQFLSETKAICYSRQQALSLYLPVPIAIQRFSSTNAPIQEWFGREGLSRKGLPNQDIIRWEPLQSFSLKIETIAMYAKNSQRWEKIVQQ
jgi:hypothetical protein